MLEVADRVRRRVGKAGANRGRKVPLNPPSPITNSRETSPPSDPAPLSVPFPIPPGNGKSTDRDWNRVLIRDIIRYTLDPLGFAKYIYPWGRGELQGCVGPYPWQAEVLNTIGEHLRNPKTRFTPLMLAIASGKGIGKSSLISMVNWWALSTCDDCRVTITANTEPQLRTKTWPEVDKWSRPAINSHWFTIGATSIKSRDPRHEMTWRADMLAWSENNPQAFAGLHNKGKRIILIFDEASEIADVIWTQADGALTDEDTEIVWLAFGNPTQNTGRFAECFGKFKHRWITKQIDSRKVPGTNKRQIQTWVEDYGEDSDFVRIWVKGEFPRAGSNQLIPSDTVDAARRYRAMGFAELPKVMAVDVARYGKNQTVIGWRQGRKSVVLGKYRGLDTVQTAERVIEFRMKEEPDAVVVDGDGLGAGVVDQMRHRGYGEKLFEFHGGHKADDADAYFNRRAEVWGLMRDWLREGAEIPDDPELATDLTGPKYGFSGKQQIQLEKKEDMEKRGMASPDCGDMLAMTFSVKVAAKRRRKEMRLVYPGQLDQSWMN